MVAKIKRNLLTCKIIVGLLSFCLFAGLFSGFGIPSFAAEAASDTSPCSPEEIHKIISGIYAWKMAEAGAYDLQALIDEEFCADPLSSTNQNYITSIIQDPYISADLSKYISSLSDALDKGVASDEGIFPTTLQKSLATLELCIEYDLGREKANIYFIPVKESKLPDYVNQKTIDTALFHTIGEKGIMSYIWGLYMLYAWDFSESSYSPEEIINTLISMQCSDGGYTLAGAEGDIDVTAMTLQVLGEKYRWLFLTGTPGDPDGAALSKSVNASLLFLSERQLSTGDYESFGTRCSESTAQTILALKALGFDIFSHPDFSKDGTTLLDGLLLYLQADGGFSHTTDGISNDMATSQALQALVSLIPEKTAVRDVVPASGVVNESFSAENGHFPYRISICIGVFILSAGVGLFFTLKRKKPIHLISAVVAALLISGVFLVLDIRSKESFENEESRILLNAGEENACSIEFTINADTISADEIYPLTTLYVAEDSTVFDVLKEVCRTEGIQLDYESNSVYGLAYIKGIDSIYEFEHGNLSGWMYRVNGITPGIGCGYYKVKNGDKVEILYSTNIGRDFADD